MVLRCKELNRGSSPVHLGELQTKVEHLFTCSCNGVAFGTPRTSASTSQLLMLSIALVVYVPL
jgi:hypothetical protein